MGCSDLKVDPACKADGRNLTSQSQHSIADMLPKQMQHTDWVDFKIGFFFNPTKTGLCFIDMSLFFEKLTVSYRMD